VSADGRERRYVGESRKEWGKRERGKVMMERW